ncbi:hypothetical protein CRE_13111 [Caenorhabditis remanei]|uniref:ISXO2-like transposase domain-containing protein n=1 Tax=Caenorhabditis remanei TaxID=31234 RepID=E3NEV9_CAERE|nr:hypothetical protein CRE_13111 [Caenorhabditis remanei]
MTHRFGLVANERKCRCNTGTMTLVTDGKNLIWRCTSCRGSSKMSLKRDSFFEGLKTSVQSLIYLAANWIENPQKTIRQTATDMKLSPDVVVDAYSWFRDISQIWFERESANQRFRLGGPGQLRFNKSHCQWFHIAGTVVEIDETLLYKAKYNRGRMLNRPQIWVFGMLQRGSNKVAMFEVPNRSAATLLPLIEAHVEPGTTIISDGWAAYGGIRNLQAGYDHRWVNHKTNFVDPLDRRVHTQGIESTWGAFKRLRKQRFGDPHESLKGHLFTYMWRRYHNHKKLLNHLLTEMLTYRRDVDGTSPPTNPVLPLLQPRQGVQQQVAFPNAPVNQNAPPPPYQQFLPYQQLPPYQQQQYPFQQPAPYQQFQMYQQGAPPNFGQGLQPQPPQNAPAVPLVPQIAPAVPLVPQIVPAVPLVPQIGPHPPQLQNGQNNQDQESDEDDDTQMQGESDEDDDTEMQVDPTSDDDVDYSSDSDSADVPVTVSNTGRRNDVRGRPRTVQTRGTKGARGRNQGSATGATRGANRGSATGAARGRNQGSATGATRGAKRGSATGAARGGNRGSATRGARGRNQGSATGAARGGNRGSATRGARGGNRGTATRGARGRTSVA